MTLLDTMTQPDSFHQQLLRDFYLPGVQLCRFMNSAALALASLGIIDDPKPHLLRVLAGGLLWMTLFVLERQATLQ